MHVEIASGDFNSGGDSRRIQYGIGKRADIFRVAARAWLPYLGYLLL
jgi:hypothetical protein